MAANAIRASRRFDRNRRREAITVSSWSLKRCYENRGEDAAGATNVRDSQSFLCVGTKKERIKGGRGEIREISRTRADRRRDARWEGDDRCWLEGCWIVYAQLWTTLVNSSRNWTSGLRSEILSAALCKVGGETSLERTWGVVICGTRGQRGWFNMEN